MTVPMNARPWMIILAIVAGMWRLDPVMAQPQDASSITQTPAVLPGSSPPAGATLDPASAVVAPAPVAEMDMSLKALFTANNIWMMVCTTLVFIMHLGFATVESGLTRAKNTCNILFKNTLIPAIGLLTYTLVGFNLMYPSEGNGWFVWPAFGLSPGDMGLMPQYTAPDNPAAYTYWTDFLFQGMFAATAATIVSGAVAERVKLIPFLIFSTVFVAISYPITGYWQWGGGWLHKMGFHDFAGSTLVHAVGGWGALMGAILLGPRLDKYADDGAVNAIPGHNMPLATIGVFLLWLGWFGFNGGSVLNGDPAGVSLVLVTTSLAAAGGAVAAAIVSGVIGGKPDLSMSLNGILAGLVGITAGADQMGPGSAILVGAISGGLVVVAVMTFDKLKIDDPVGAISVHLVCGVWGTLAVGLFGQKAGLAQLGKQAVGVAAISVFTAAFAGLLFIALRSTTGIRVSESEEIEGLDLGEHDMAAYPDFQQTYIKSYHAREI